MEGVEGGDTAGAGGRGGRFEEERKREPEPEPAVAGREVDIRLEKPAALCDICSTLVLRESASGAVEVATGEFAAKPLGTGSSMRVTLLSEGTRASPSLSVTLLLRVSLEASEYGDSARGDWAADVAWLTGMLYIKLRMFILSAYVSCYET